MGDENDGIATPEDWAAFRSANPDIEGIDAFVMDCNGTVLGKRVAIEDAAKIFKDGVQFSASAPIADCRGLGHNPLGIGTSDGDPDGTALPLARTLRRMTWTRAPLAQVACSMRDISTLEPLWFDPREVLRRVVGQCTAAGIRPVVACELEFYLVDRERDPDGSVRVAPIPGHGVAPRRPANLCLNTVEASAEFLQRIDAAARALDLPVSGVLAEYGMGQYEVNLRHVADPLAAADHAVLLRRLVKGVAQSMGVVATFMAKPFAEQAGSGLHMHASIVDENGRNRFGAPGGEVLLEQAIAGMQDLMFDSIGFFAPNFNSHRRYSGPFVPTTRHWAHNNRSVAFRVPAAGAEARRIEHRVAGADASPHLVMAAILAGLLHGLTGSLVATKPVTGKVNDERDHRFPDGVLAALERLRSSRKLRRYFEPRYLEAFAHMKRGEYAALTSAVFPRELDFYL
jgi:glutamine synthetase